MTTFTTIHPDDDVADATIVVEDDNKYSPKNIKLFRFVGTILGGAAIAIAGWLLINPHDTVTVDRATTVNGAPATVPVTRDVIAWSQDALVGAMAPLAVLLVIAAAFFITKKLTNDKQRAVAILAVFVAGGFACPWAYDRYKAADFVEANAWRGFWSALVVVAALVMSHLYYWDYKKSS